MQMKVESSWDLCMQMNFVHLKSFSFFQSLLRSFFSLAFSTKNNKTQMKITLDSIRTEKKYII